MPDLTAKRTLVKSPPELWEELSEVERLAKHLGAFGEIKITKLEPEHTVAWEGERASGTVSIEPSGWGTKVTLTAQLEQGVKEGEALPAVAAAPEPRVEEPAVEEPAAEEVVIEELVVEEVVPDESAALNTAAGEEVEDEAAEAAEVVESGADEVVMAEPWAVGLVAEEPVAEEPMAEEPMAEEAVV